MRSLVAAAGFILLVPAAAQQDVALKNLMPKGMVVGARTSSRRTATRCSPGCAIADA